jgi:hypothetical protein
MSISYQIGDATSPNGDAPRIIIHVCNDSGGWGRGFVVGVSRISPTIPPCFHLFGTDFALKTGVWTMQTHN